MSLIEAVTNVAVGYGLAVTMQMLVFPLFGLHASLADNLLIGGVFTVASIARSFSLCRLFEAIRLRGGIRTRIPAEQHRQRLRPGCRADIRRNRE